MARDDRARGAIHEINGTVKHEMYGAEQVAETEANRNRSGLVFEMPAGEDVAAEQMDWVIHLSWRITNGEEGCSCMIRRGLLRRRKGRSGCSRLYINIISAHIISIVKYITHGISHSQHQCPNGSGRTFVFCISIHPHATKTPTRATQTHHIKKLILGNLVRALFVFSTHPTSFLLNVQTPVPKTKHPLPPSLVSHSPCSLLRFINNLFSLALIPSHSLSLNIPSL